MENSIAIIHYCLKLKILIPILIPIIIIIIITGIDFMVVLGAFAPESCDFATRSQIIGAKFVNGHINYQLEHFENFSNFLKFSVSFYT